MLAGHRSSLASSGEGGSVQTGLQSKIRPPEGGILPSVPKRIGLQLRGVASGSWPRGRGLGAYLHHGPAAPNGISFGKLAEKKEGSVPVSRRRVR